MRIRQQGRRRGDNEDIGRRFRMRRMHGHQLRELSLMKKLKIGTRGSKLALWQADFVKKSIENENPGLSVELVTIKTKGDKILDVPLAKVGGKGLFVKEIEEALLDGRVDLAVHSLKDMPADIPEGLRLGAFCEREVPADVFISGNGAVLKDLPEGARVGTSSLRRAAQLKKAFPGVSIVSLRGNLDTRLKKIETENLDGIILAAAGVRRLGLEERIAEYIDEAVMLPAVGQGALCIEIRENDPETENAIAHLDHLETRTAVLCERAFLHRLEGGCQVPIAAYGKVDGESLTLEGLVADVEGKTVIRETLSGNVGESENIGLRLAEILLSRGAAKILDQLKE